MSSHCFTSLPAEIRFTIWKLMIIARVVKIRKVFCNDSTPVPLPRFSCSGAYHPPLLAVSQESRKIGLEHYVIITTPEASDQNGQASDQAIYIHPTVDTLYLDFGLDRLPRSLHISDSLRLVQNIAVFANFDLGPNYQSWILRHQERIAQFVQAGYQAKDIRLTYFDSNGRINYKNEGSMAQCFECFRQPKTQNLGAASSTEKVAIFPRLRTLYLVVKDDCEGEAMAPSAVRFLEKSGINHIRDRWRNSAKDHHEDFPEIEQVHLVECEFQNHTQRSRGPIQMPRGIKIPNIGELMMKCVQENGKRKLTKR